MPVRGFLLTIKILFKVMKFRLQQSATPDGSSGTGNSGSISPESLLNQVDQGFQAAEKLYEEGIQFVVAYGFQIVGAGLIFLLGYWLSGKAQQVMFRLCQKRKLDITLSKFLSNIVKITAMTFVVILVLNQFGITITPFIAAIGAGAFGLSLAVQGPISNYGAGLSLIITRPFNVGQTLTVQGRSGVVQEIKLAHTVILTEDGETITIPNRHVVGEIYENTYEFTLVDGVIGIPYSVDPEKAITLILDEIGGLPSVTESPEPQVGIHAFNDSSIDIGFRCWVPTLQYHQSRYALNLAVFKALKSEGIEVPFPQREVRILKSGD